MPDRSAAAAVLTAMLVCSACGTDSAPPPAPAAPVSVPSASSVDPPTAEGSLALSLTSNGTEILASWIEPAPDDAHWVRFATFDGPSRRWSDATTVVEGDDLLASSVELPTAIRTATGSLFVTFLRRGTADEASSVHLATSRDGQAWRLLGPVHDDATDTEHGHMSLLTDAGRARVVWLDGRAWTEGGPMALRTALLGDDGAIVAEDVLDTRVCDCCQTAAAFAGAGALVVYRDRDDDERRDVSIVRHLETGWTAPMDVARDGWTIRGCPVNGPQISASGERVAVAWYTEAGDRARARVAFSSDAGAHFDAPIELDDGRTLGRVDVASMDDGTAIAVWLGAPDETDARVLLRRIAPDRRVGRSLELASIGGTAAFGAPQLVRLGADLMVAWAEPGPPRRVRAALVRATDVAAVDGEPTPTTSPAPPGAIGEIPLDVTLPVLGGGESSLRSLRGRPLVLSFFATWCEPCRAELPILASLAREHGDAIAVVGVSVDEADATQVDGFVREHGLPYAVLLDPAGAAAGGRFGVPPLPATFVLDADGRIVFAHRGGDADIEASLRAAVAAALAPATHDHAH